MSRRAKEAFTRGYAALQSRRFKQAITDFTVAIDCGYQPIAWAYTNRGLVYLNDNDNVSAIKDFNNALHKDPDTAFAYYNRGQAYENMGNATRAKLDYQKVLDLPNFYGSHKQAQLSMGKLNQNYPTLEQAQKNGNSGGEATLMATVYSQGDKEFAHLSSNGDVYDPNNTLLGRVEPEGNIYAPTCRHWGWVTADGKFYQVPDIQMGHVDEAGKVYISSKSYWGHVHLNGEASSLYSVQVIGGAAFILGLLLEMFGNVKYL